MTVDGQLFHPECFVCASCRQPIAGPFVKDDKGRLCAGCQPRCEICQEPLAGHSTLKLDGRRIHEDCFRCCGCNKVLRGGHFKEGPGRYQCGDCRASAWQAREDDLSSRVVALEQRVKARNAADYRLSWRPELAPCSRQALQALGVGGRALPASKQVCVCYDTATKQVTVVAAPRCEPRVAVNISYLATALRVLRRTGREPQFSLDPKDPHDISGELQVKKFYPSWLATTVAGEVLFQADYELKELCLGDKVLPGLPNVFDEWVGSGSEGRAARQWFVIRRAGVTIASDGALVPHCEMGVDARQLVPGKEGYVDAPHTNPNDPMVRMAQAISEHFAEVAAQLPAVAELVRLARATVLARCLLEHGCRCDESALERFPFPRCPEGEGYSMEIPTLRKKRRSASVTRQGSQLLMQKQQRSMHGGVDLGVKAEKVPTRAARRPLLGPEPGPRAPLPLFAAPAA